MRVYRGDHSPLPRDWFFAFAGNSRTMSALIAEDPLPVGISRAGTIERATASVVSENFFRDLGVGPSLGSVFMAAPGEPVGAFVVLGHEYWSARLGSDTAIVGRAIRLNDTPFTVIGVASADFTSSQFGWSPDLFVPLTQEARLRGVADETLAGSSTYVTARLADGRTPEQAESEVLAMAGALPEAPEELSRPGAFTVEPARGIVAEVRTQAAIVSAFLLFVAGAVLLIACANLANLLLARASARRREIAVRVALGVKRSALVRQLLTESLVLSAVGGAVGFAIAAVATRLLPALLPADAPVAFDVSPDGNVLVFTIVLAALTGLVFGIAPALRASSTDVQDVLRSTAPGAGARRSRLRSAFVVGQIGLATALLVVAGLFLRGIGAARDIDPGFDSERVADLAIDLSLRQYDEERGRLFYGEVLRSVRDLPFVGAATLIRMVPLSGSNAGTGVSLPTADPDDRSAIHGTTFTQVAPGYFEMFDIPILRGRGFGPSDREGAPEVIVVNQSLARMMWPDDDAVGQRVRFDDRVVTVVGVTPDTKYKSLNDRNEPFAYLPSTQSYSDDMVLQVRLARNSAAERAAVRAAVQRIDPALPIGMMNTMQEDMRLTMLPARIAALLLVGFGLLALFLATLGVYGVTAYLVGQRTREIGIRSALGATTQRVLGAMMRETVVLVLVGLGVGLAGGIGLGKLISSWLYGVGALDPVALGAASLVLLFVATVGTWLPARRALAVDPMTALRSE